MAISSQCDQNFVVREVLVKWNVRSSLVICAASRCSGRPRRKRSHSCVLQPEVSIFLPSIQVFAAASTASNASACGTGAEAGKSRLIHPLVHVNHCAGSLRVEREQSAAFM